MASCSITARPRKDGGKRYVVRYRLGGRAYPVQHGGAFPTLREARIRRNLIAGELARSRDPADLLRSLVDKRPVRTFGQVAEAYRVSRVDLADETTKNLASHLKAILPVFEHQDPSAITFADVQSWV